jgi:large subunit ribosomal protein L9
MKVILRQSVENLGRPGEVVRVKDGYARNYLIPQKLALPLTDGNLKQVEQEKQRLAVKETKLRGEAEEVAARFAGTRLTFTKKAGEEGILYGSVTTSEIAEALARKGFVIDRRRLIVSDAIKRVGEFVVTARLHPEVELEVAVLVEPEGGLPIPSASDEEKAAEHAVAETEPPEAAGEKSE